MTKPPTVHLLRFPVFYMSGFASPPTELLFFSLPFYSTAKINCDKERIKAMAENQLDVMFCFHINWQDMRLQLNSVTIPQHDEVATEVKIGAAGDCANIFLLPV